MPCLASSPVAIDHTGNRGSCITVLSWTVTNTSCYGGSCHEIPAPWRSSHVLSPPTCCGPCTAKDALVGLRQFKHVILIKFSCLVRVAPQRVSRAPYWYICQSRRLRGRLLVDEHCCTASGVASHWYHLILLNIFATIAHPRHTRQPGARTYQQAGTQALGFDS